MSNSEKMERMVDEARYIRDLAKASNDNWKNGPKITIEDVLHGNRAKGIEKVRPGELFGQESKASSGAKPKQNCDSTTHRRPAVITFGKHYGRLIVDIAEEDPDYLRWCIRDDIKGMRAKCEAMGITEDDL